MHERYKIIISEPWNYENDIGKNLITGYILKRISNRCSVFVSDIPFEFEGNEGNILVLFNRYSSHDTTNQLNGMTVNGGLLLIDFDDSYDEAALEKNSKFVIIGRLEKY